MGEIESERKEGGRRAGGQPSSEQERGVLHGNRSACLAEDAIKRETVNPAPPGGRDDCSGLAAEFRKHPHRSRWRLRLPPMPGAEGTI